MRPAGKVNLIGLALILAACAGVWWVVLVVPLYSDHMDVTDAVGVAVSMYHREGDEGVRARLLNAVSRIGTHREYDEETGEQKVVPGLAVTAENINIIVDEKKQLVHITLDYDRDLELTPFKKLRRLHFQAERKGPLTP